MIKIITPVLLSSILLLPIESIAQNKRDALTKKSGQSLTTGEKSKSALPAFDKSFFEETQSSPKAIDPKSLRPSRSSQFLKSENEDYNAYSRILDQQINELRKLISKTQSNSAKGELWLRLAELYVEKADLVKTIIDQRYDQQLKQLRDKNPSAQPPQIDYSPAAGYNKTAIQLYERFLKEYPKDPRVDQALFFLGYNYFELGDTKKGLGFYQRLAKEYPRSNYIIESRFALGEYYFENNDFKQALAQYQVVAKSRNKKLAAFSNYKTAWSHFKLGDYKSAIIGLEKIVRAAQVDKKASVEMRLDTEAKRDMILFYVEAGKADRAVNYFNGLFGTTEGFNYLEKLAYVYSDRGDRDSARTLFTYLSAQRPNHPKSFDYQYQIVRLYSNAKDTEIFKSEMYKWIKTYGPKSQWYEANAGNKELTSRSTALLEQTLRVWVLQQHQTAQNSRGDFSQKMAASGYRLYFAEFESFPAAAELHFFYGELLYDMNKFDEASKEYRWVVDNGGNSKYRSQAATNILLAAEKSLPTDKAMADKIGDSLDPVPLGPAVENYMTQAAWYLRNFPADKKAAETKFRMGRLYYQHNHFDKAIPYFKTVVKEHSDTKFAEYSANLLLDIYNLRKDYEGLAKYSQELLAVPAIANSPAGKEIQDVLQKANFKKAQDTEGKNDFKTSAAEYEKFAAEYPKSDLASMALFNAAVNYNKANQPGKSVVLLQNLSQRKDPKAIELKSKIAFFMPQLYRDSGQLEKAAGAHVAAAQIATQKNEQANNYYNAALLYEALDQRSRAIVNFTKYYELAKGRDKVNVLFNMATIFRKNNQRTKAKEHYERFLNESSGVSAKSVESAFWLSQISGKAEDREKWANTTIRLFGQLPSDQKEVANSYPAKIEIERLKLVYRDLWSIKLNNLSRLKVLSDRKIEFLEIINKKAATVVKYNSPEEILEAVKIVGDSNLNMYDSLVNSPVPPELTKADDIQKYKDSVKSQLADPFLAKSLEAYELVVQRSSEFETYTEFSSQARDQILKLKPGSLYEVGQAPLDRRSADWMGL